MCESEGVEKKNERKLDPNTQPERVQLFCEDTGYSSGFLMKKMETQQSGGSTDRHRIATRCLKVIELHGPGWASLLLILISNLEESLKPILEKLKGTDRPNRQDLDH